MIGTVNANSAKKSGAVAPAQRFSQLAHHLMDVRAQHLNTFRGKAVVISERKRVWFGRSLVNIHLFMKVDQLLVARCRLDNVFGERTVETIRGQSGVVAKPRYDIVIVGDDPAVPTAVQ
jgi:hypothetical protein